MPSSDSLHTSNPCTDTNCVHTHSSTSTTSRSTSVKMAGAANLSNSPLTDPSTDLASDVDPPTSVSSTSTSTNDPALKSAATTGTGTPTSIPSDPTNENSTTELPATPSPNDGMPVTSGLTSGSTVPTASAKVPPPTSPSIRPDTIESTPTTVVNAPSTQATNATAPNLPASNSTLGEGQTTSHHSSTGAIAGGVVGGIVGLAVIALLLLCFRRHTKKSRSSRMERLATANDSYSPRSADVTTMEEQPEKPYSGELVAALSLRART